MRFITSDVSDIRITAHMSGYSHNCAYEQISGYSHKQEASRQLATMIGQNPFIRHRQHQRCGPEDPGHETQDEELCFICQMTIDGLAYNESIPLLRCSHYYHTVCIDTGQET